MKHDERGFSLVPGQAGAHLEAADGDVAFAARAHLLIERLDIVAVDLRVGFRRAEDETDGVMNEHAIEVDLRRPNELFPNTAAVLQAWNVAWRFFQNLDEILFVVFIKVPGQLHGALGITQTLRRLQPADFIKKPAATRVHKQGVPLHLHEPACFADFLIVERGLAPAEVVEETAHRLLATVEDNADVAVARFPGVREYLLAAPFQE